MSERPCILHVGTHKTGTTSLQVGLQENLDALHRAGLHFVQSAWHGVVPGSAELAWELMGGRHTALLSTVVDELRASPYRTAIVSAEDLSLLHANPRALAVLADAVRSAGYTPRVLVYLRAQGPFAESMYVERVKQGHVRPIERYLETIERTGSYLPDGTAQTIAFEYTKLLEPFVAEFGREFVEARAYPGDHDSSLLFNDFLGALRALDPEFARYPLNLQIGHPRVNGSLAFVQLLGTLHMMLRPDEPLPEDPMEFIRVHAPEVSEADAHSRFALFGRSEHLRLMRRFAGDNAIVASTYAAAIPFVSETDVPGPKEPYWLRARAERAAYDRCLAAWSPASEAGQQMSSAAAGQTDTV